MKPFILYKWAQFLSARHSSIPENHHKFLYWLCIFLISGNRLKCVSCRIIVHESCSASLNDLFTCRPSFCESVRKYREFTSIPHHWVQRKQLKVRINATINISQLNKGAFNNYVDQILPKFDSQPPSRGQTWTFYILSTL